LCRDVFADTPGSNLRQYGSPTHHGCQTIDIGIPNN
jgi:hypothetical protein